METAFGKVENIVGKGLRIHLTVSMFSRGLSLRLSGKELNEHTTKKKLILSSNLSSCFHAFKYSSIRPYTFLLLHVNQVDIKMHLYIHQNI